MIPSYPPLRKVFPQLLPSPNLFIWYVKAHLYYLIFTLFVLGIVLIKERAVLAWGWGRESIRQKAMDAMFTIIS